MRPPPLAVDLFCGLGGWTEGLLAEGYREGYLCYDSIWPTRRVLSLIVSGKRLTNLGNAGCGRRVFNGLVTESSWSIRASLRAWLIGLPMNYRWDQFQKDSKFFTVAMCQRVFARIICFSVHKKTISATAERKVDGNTSRVISAENETQTRFYRMLMSDRCWQSSLLAGSL